METKARIYIANILHQFNILSDMHKGSILCGEMCSKWNATIISTAIKCFINPIVIQLDLQAQNTRTVERSVTIDLV